MENLKQLNEILRDLPNLRRSTPEGVEIVKRINSNGGDGEQGEEGVSYEVYKLPIDNLYVKLKITTDSYGDNEAVSGIEFVSPVEKTVTTYE
jgi:hypothetical protein